MIVAGERWRAVASEKLPVVEEMIRRATGMKHLLEAGLACQCSVIEECFLEGCRPRAGSTKRKTPLPIAGVGSV